MYKSQKKIIVADSEDINEHENIKINVCCKFA